MMKVMIDSITLKISGAASSEKILACPGLTFQEQKSKKGNQFYTASLRGLTIEVYPSGTVWIRGSIHRFINNGENNSTDLDRLSLFDGVFELSEILGVHPSLLSLHGFEFGVNLTLQLEPGQVISKIIAYKAKGLKEFPEGEGIRFDFSQYALKAYNKSAQFSLPTYRFRFEVKIKKMEKIASAGLEIKTLHDLMKVQVLKELGVILCKEWENLVLVEPINLSTMKPKERNWYEQYSKPESWGGIDKTQRRDYLKKFNGLIETHSNGPTIKNEIGNLIKLTWSSLMNEASTTDRENLNVSLSDRGGEEGTEKFSGREDLGKSHFLTIWVRGQKEGKTVEKKFTFSSTTMNDRIRNFGEELTRPDKKKEVMQIYSFLFKKKGCKNLTEKRIKELGLATILNSYRKQYKRKTEDLPEEHYASHNARNDKSNAIHNPGARLLREEEKWEQDAQLSLFDCWVGRKFSPQELNIISKLEQIPKCRFTGMIERINAASAR